MFTYGHIGDIYSYLLIIKIGPMFTYDHIGDIHSYRRDTLTYWLSKWGQCSLMTTFVTFTHTLVSTGDKTLLSSHHYKLLTIGDKRKHL